MKIVIALDSFKGVLDAESACRAVAKGLHDVLPAIKTVLKPMADGGEGTVRAILAARSDGKWIPAQVSGPLPRKKVKAGYAWFEADKTALVEMAAANGLPLLKESERNPLKTSTYGTGELIAMAIKRGAKRIFLAIGGSATIDGGVGAATALGWKFLDVRNRVVPLDGGHLQSIAKIIPPKNKTFPPVTILCDVTNPLCGTQGAAAVFGPQKGATPAMVKQLEAGLFHLAKLVQKHLGCNILSMAGGGAAGGLGAGGYAFLNAKLESGIQTVMKISKLREVLIGADWCITGEGSFDNQSFGGKVISGVTSLAKEVGVPVVVFAGLIRVSRRIYRTKGIYEALATHAPDMPMNEVIANEPEHLRKTAACWLQKIISKK